MVRQAHHEREAELTTDGREDSPRTGGRTHREGAGWFAANRERLTTNGMGDSPRAGREVSPLKTFAKYSEDSCETLRHPRERGDPEEIQSNRCSHESQLGVTSVWIRILCRSVSPLCADAQRS